MQTTTHSQVSSPVKAHKLQDSMDTQMNTIPGRTGSRCKHWAALIVIGLLAACQNVELGTRSFTDSLPVKRIPGAPLPIDLNLSVGLAIDSAIINVEADSRFLTSARLRSLSVFITEDSDFDAIEDGAQDSFYFISGLSVSIRARFNNRLNEQIVAFLPEGDPQIGTSARTLSLTTSSADVLDYLQANGGYELLLNFDGTVPPDDVIFSGIGRFRVGVGI